MLQSTAPRDEVLVRVLHYDRLKGVPIYTLDMVRELSGSFTRHTLTQFECHVGLVAVENMEADAVKVGSALPNEDYLVDQMPPQYYHDPSPPRPFYSYPGATSSNGPLSVTRGDLKEYFQRLQMDFFILVL
ncbi:hypothetical protein F0562_017677 [Nyssa sinensis]|uniref:Uncharacterized protein n=1 Tax=Nyssa sinensis TaxID=561372 RepID=A0A5J4ZHL8_9ASTE|nr:hypothetical protein F0562_017677 [Nyssa sinensis]